MTKCSYDSKSFDMAEWFLPEDLPSPQANLIKSELAQHIQDAIEGWLVANQTRLDGIMNEVEP